MNQEFFEQVEGYITGLFVPEDAALTQAIADADAAGMPPIHISPGQGKLLYLLVKMSRATRVLEIGTLAGFSTIWMARALPAGGKLISLELSENHAEVARGNLARAGVGDRVEVVVGPALESLERLRDSGEGSFDFIFIDADKPSYPAYLEAVLPLSHSGTVIVADNVIRAGAVMDEEPPDEMARGARAFNAALAQRTDVEAIVMQQVGTKEHDGLAIGIVK